MKELISIFFSNSFHAILSVNHEESNLCLKWKFPFSYWQNLGITVNSSYNPFWSNLRFHTKMLLTNGSHKNDLKLPVPLWWYCLDQNDKNLQIGLHYPLCSELLNTSGLRKGSIATSFCRRLQKQKARCLPPDVTSLRKQGRLDDFWGHPGVGASCTHFGGPVPFSR